MFDSIKAYFKGRQLEKEVIEGYKLVCMIIFKKLFYDYKRTMDEFDAKVLAAQVGNYLMGTSIERVMSESDEKLKSKIEEFMSRIPQEAYKLMDSDLELRKMVVDSLRFKEITDWAHFGKDKANSLPEKKQMDEIISKYGESVPYNINSDEYLKRVKSVFQSEFASSR